LVTAKHVVDAVSGRSYVTRVNSSDGSPKPVWADTGSDANVKWWFHPTEADAVDVAVAPWVIAPDEDIQSIPVELFLTAASIDATGIGPGDQVFFPGCFTLLTGEQKNYPIVRTGNIAMMPGEPISNVKIGSWNGDIEGYLIEARSIGGLSGSPVFARQPIYMSAEIQAAGTGKLSQTQLTVLGQPYLLGLMHGHWSIKSEAENDIVIRPYKGKDHAHLGISIVIPARKILEVINHPDFVNMRKQADAQWEQSKETSEPDS
jgi:hypothetical protein